MRIGWLLAFALLTFAPGAAVAQMWHQYDSDDPLVIDPAKAYIFYRTSLSGVGVRFLREYESGESPGPVRRNDPMSERDRWVQFTHSPRFSGKSYLRSVRPGSYILYGNMLIGLNGAHVGVCLCMGSLRFDAPPGKIVDLGLLVWPDVGKTERPWGITVTPFDSTMAVPPRLAGLPRIVAEFRAAPKLPNIFGLEIDRHDPLAGVLTYDRDLPIDVRTGRPAVPPR